MFLASHPTLFRLGEGGIVALCWTVFGNAEICIYYTTVQKLLSLIVGIRFAEHNFGHLGRILRGLVLFEREFKTLFRVLFLVWLWTNPRTSARDRRVGVKSRYFEKLKINISTGNIQMKFSTRKHSNTRSILLLWLVANYEEFKRYSSFSRYEIQNI
jgi:hypothetical protein